MEKGKEKSRILIADDNEPNVELLEAYLAGSMSKRPSRSMGRIRSTRSRRSSRI